MSKKIFFLFIAISLGSLSAQNFIKKVTAYPAKPEKIAAGDTLKILAVMVNFAADRDETTFGNGKFGSIYTKNYGSSIIDPLPHDRSYFEAHLEFAKNYFRKVSDGKLNISYYVLPDTFSVSQTMRNYSVPSNSENFEPLADFSQEVWNKASEIYPDFEFLNYDLFIIFHAGVGRELTIPGSLGNERDLPSIYLSFNSLKEIYGDSFSGFSVPGGNITNSLIMPETESRELSSLNETVLIELSINGLLVSSIGSHLGLPDLFDTETGRSAIGRFGLMDGQAIFAYNGLFPPEPSPWEKMYLGWIEPVTIDPGNYNINLVADLAASVSDTTILKAAINSTEYYLIENRIRDVNDNGAIIKYVLNGDTLTQTFQEDTTGFYYYDIDSLKGVIIDVDEFDWAVPGNGIVIWHIDENIIESKIGQNRINADKDNRGIDVEEADGIQDLGEEFINIFGEVQEGEGSPDDFWFSSNESEFYENRFGKDTRPSTVTNSGANSLITISGFSDISGRMSFNISYGDSIINPLFSTQLNLTSGNNYLTNFTNYFALLNGSELVLIDQNGNEISRIQDFSDFKPAATGNFLIGTSGTNLNIYNLDNQQVNSVNLGENISAPPVIEEINSERNVLLGTSNGKIFTFSVSSSPVKTDSLVIPGNVTVNRIVSDGVFKSYIVNQSGLYLNNEQDPVFSGEDILDIALTKNKTGSYTVIILTEGNNFKIISNGNIQNEFKINSSQQVTSFSLADLKQDGENYIIFTNGNKLEARNVTGTSADNFPFEDPLQKSFTGTPLAADFEGNINSEVIASTIDGRIFAVDGGSGKIVNGFPISSGTELTAVPVFFVENNMLSLAVNDNENSFKAWNIGAAEGTVFWNEKYGNNKNNSFVETAGNNFAVNEFFPENRAYNYPNPVYGSETAIHYYVSEDSKINIKIFDLAGDFVAELNDNAAGGLNNETIWNVSDIQSGVYLARIEASGVSGRTENAIIKIAIIK